MFPPVPASAVTTRDVRRLCPRSRPVVPWWVHVLVLSPAVTAAGLLLYTGSL